MTNPPPKWSTARTVLLVLAAPWWVLWGFWRVGRGLAIALRAVWTLPSALSDHVPCPACRERNALLGRWQCKCGFVYLGHAFAPCPSCSAVAGWIECVRCGAGIRPPAA